MLNANYSPKCSSNISIYQISKNTPKLACQLHYWLHFTTVLSAHPSGHLNRNSIQKTDTKIQVWILLWLCSHILSLWRDSRVLLSGLERGATPILQGSCEQGISPLSPALPLPGWVSGQRPPRQAHRPDAASHTLRRTHAQERCYTLDKVRSTATFAQADNSTVLTHSAPPTSQLQ